MRGVATFMRTGRARSAVSTQIGLGTCLDSKGNRSEVTQIAYLSQDHPIDALYGDSAVLDRSAKQAQVRDRVRPRILLGLWVKSPEGKAVCSLERASAGSK